MVIWPFKRKTADQANHTADMIEQARQNPGGWVYDIDAAIGDPMGEVPPFAIKGAHKVDDAGQIIGDFQPNKNYDHDKTTAWVAARDAKKD